MKEKEGLTPRIPNFNTRRTRQVGLHDPAAVDCNLETDSHMAVKIAAIMKRYVTKLQDIQVNRGDNEEIRYEATRYTSKSRR
jgi:hypothetical protein